VNEISRATDRQIDIDELLRERDDIQSVLAAVGQGIPPNLQGESRETLLGEASQLARNRREALRELQTVYGRYIGQLTSLDLAERQLVSLSGDFTRYIDDQLLWIPGRGIEALVGPAAVGNALLWFLSPTNWLELIQDLWALLFGKLGLLLLVALAFILLVTMRRRAFRSLIAVAEDTRRIRTDSFLLTLRALGLTLVIVGALPFLMVSLGWLMSRVPTAGTFSLMMANGLMRAGLTLFSLGFLRQICLPNGLGDCHLSWPKPIRESIAREIGWLIPVVVPLGFLVAASVGSVVPLSAQGFGQLAFIALMFVSAVFLYRLLNSKGRLMLTAREQGEPGALVQLHFIWFPLFVLLPLALALIAALGYQYAAVNLKEQAEVTFWFFVVLFLLKEMLLRSLYVAERRLRLQDALRRRDELRAQREREEQHEDEAAPVISLDIPELDFDQLGDQAKRLIRAGYLFSAVIGTWFIWSDLLPALGFLNSTELPFQASRIIDGVAKDVPVTLGDLVAGLIIAVITLMAAKNLPGILEITLLQRLPLEPGARYAITSLSQYLIAGIGLITAFSSLGLQWSSIQWLVAALSVGLGFGLQEIVANFISGIILLFERPIRVGDVVTVNNTTGKVSRIRIRATIITNWERQELLIPNKQFITSEVINWTLTDKVNRIMITVGVAYGSDVPKAMQLMLDAANENAEVLEDPQPVASFEAFGDNALTLFLRSYLGNMDYRLATITALHQAINDKFVEAGIEIAFPQRDVHFDAAQPLEIRVSRASKGGGEAPV
jgi:potassium efflux system protein